MTTTVVCVPGTAEPANNSGMLGKVTKKLPANIEVRWVDYAGDFGYKEPYESSYARGYSETEELVRRAGRDADHVIIVGFSQGADIAGSITESIAAGRGPIPATKVPMVALLADPRRRSADTPDPKPGRRGIGGARRPGSFGNLNVFSYAIDGDLIPACPENLTLLASLADASTRVLLSSPEATQAALVEWVNKKYNEAPWWIKFGYWLQLPDTMRALAFNIGKHEQYGVTGGPGGVAATDHVVGNIKAAVNLY